jgi:hypothetical protein
MHGPLEIPSGRDFSYPYPEAIMPRKKTVAVAMSGGVIDAALD